MIAQLVASLLLLASCFFLYRRRRIPNLPPGPFEFPIVGNLPQLLSLSHRSLSVLSRRHGPLMRLQVGPCFVLVASSAATAREVLKVHDLVFASRPRLTAAVQLLYGLKDVIFAPYGEHWRQARRVCVLHLLSAKRVQSYRSVREEEVVSVVRKIRGQSLSGPVNLSEMMRVFSSGVISRVALGKKYEERWQIIDQVAYLVGEIFLQDFFPWLAWVSRATGKDLRLMRCFRELDSFLDEVMDDHAKRHPPGGEDVVDGDLVDVLLALQRYDEAGIFLNRDCIKAIILMTEWSVLAQSEVQNLSGAWPLWNPSPPPMSSLTDPSEVSNDSSNTGSHDGGNPVARRRLTTREYRRHWRARMQLATPPAERRNARMRVMAPHVVHLRRDDEVHRQWPYAMQAERRRQRCGCEQRGRHHTARDWAGAAPWVARTSTGQRMAQVAGLALAAPNAGQRWATPSAYMRCAQPARATQAARHAPHPRYAWPLRAMRRGSAWPCTGHMGRAGRTEPHRPRRVAQACVLHGPAQACAAGGPARPMGRLTLRGSTWASAARPMG